MKYFKYKILDINNAIQKNDYNSIEYHLKKEKYSQNKLNIYLSDAIMTNKSIITIQLLINYGADINTYNSIRMLCYIDYIIVKKLMKYLTEEYLNYFTMLTSMSDKKKLFDLCNNYSIKPNIDKYKDVLLRISIINCNLSMVYELMNLGASIKDYKNTIIEEIILEHEDKNMILKIILLKGAVLNSTNTPDIFKKYKLYDNKLCYLQNIKTKYYDLNLNKQIYEYY